VVCLETIQWVDMLEQRQGQACVCLGEGCAVLVAVGEDGGGGCKCL
jgi:hypothetical protein